MLILLIASGDVLGWKETEISRDVPLPRKIEIVPPSADCPKEIAAFSGRWEGIWEGGRRQSKSVLIVEEINSEGAKVVYGWSGYYNVKADYQRHKAKVIPGGIIQFSGPHSDEWMIHE